MSENGLGKHDMVLAQLVYMLESAAMQQLGKLVDSATGEAKCDLDQARGTIDILEMLKYKCRTDTPEDLLRVMDTAVMNLQLNYLDEVKKAHPSDGTQASQTAEAENETPAAADAAEAAGDAPADGKAAD